MSANSVTVVASYMGNVMGVKITAHKAASASRTPFHLVLLVDVSGSMAGERINEVKHTILELMKLMDPMDYISIITYHSSGDILLNSVKMEGDTAAYMAAVSSIHIMGGTNLEAGLSKLSEITLPPSSVFLLTDGMILEGNTDPGYLITYARLSLPSDTPIHTLGYGPDHNQTFLRDLGLRSHASYTYADRNETIPLIIGNILGSLTTEVGRSTKLIIPPGYRSLELNFDGSIGRLIDEKTHWV
jgi:secreted protein with Ig-like and vWFA domain